MGTNNKTTEAKYGDVLWDKMMRILVLFHRGLRAKDIAQDVGWTSREVTYWRDKAINEPAAKVEQFPQEAREFCIENNPKLKEELDKRELEQRVRQSEELFSFYMDKWIEHRQMLCDLAGIFAANWERNLRSGPIEGYEGFVMTDEELDEIDFTKAKNLLDHLKEEYDEFGEVEKWQDLVCLKLNPKAIEKIYWAASDHKFVGQCDACKSWPKLD
jgi:hypothetical protein